VCHPRVARCGTWGERNGEGLAHGASPLESIRARRGLISEDYGTEEDARVA